LSEIKQNIVNSRNNRQQGRIHDIHQKDLLRLFCANNRQFFKGTIT
jgi:hypothetical protein